MEITLTPELERYVQAKVSSGEYSSANEVLLAGIKRLQDLEQTYQGRFEALRDEVRIGLEAAERGEVADSDKVFKRLAAILAEIESLKLQAGKINDYTPETPLGQQLWSIRQRAVASGMPLQPAEDIAAAISTERNRQHTPYEDLS